MKLGERTRRIFFACGFLLFGVIIGGYIFSDVQPRSIIALTNCGSMCYQPKDVLGLLSAIGIEKLDGNIPGVIMETDKSIVIKHPTPATPVHYVVIPKKDIKNAAGVSAEDTPYLADAFAVMAQLIEQDHLVQYKITTNGPGLQAVTYLHFHLVSNEEPDK
ncbi:MAG: HIT domain-containing protein [Patescibacteria group bacterium]|jgi:histidine triad (HIT) family protein